MSVGRDRDGVVGAEEGYSFTTRQSKRMALHSHAAVSLDILGYRSGGGGLRLPSLLAGLLASECYQRLFLAHVKTPWRGVRGPFRIDGLTPQDFEQIPAYAVAPMMQDILEGEHWKTPESTPGEIGRICGLVERLAQPCAQGFRLRRCDGFNARDRLTTSYEHEWAHALMEFHEFVLLDPATSHCHLLNLVYE